MAHMSCCRSISACSTQRRKNKVVLSRKQDTAPYPSAESAEGIPVNLPHIEYRSNCIHVRVTGTEQHEEGIGKEKKEEEGEEEKEVEQKLLLAKPSRS